MKQKITLPLSSYQKFIIFILAITQFSVILDFMVMSPLGDMLMKSMNLSTKQFGIAVSAYAFSAGISGLLTAGFADKFDRKKLLLFFYTGFVIATFFCGMAHTYPLLVTARIVTGLFGGVIGSISMAIITDLFAMEQRGRVLGFVQMGFGASQVLGIPISLYIANKWGWQSPFLMVAGLGAVIALAIAARMQPITAHLAIQRERSAIDHLVHTLLKKNYRTGFSATALLAIGGFMMMPFGSAFAINNLGINNDQLTMLFMVSGIASLFIMPLIGRLSDKVDRFKIFTVASLWMVTMVLIYTHLSVTPLWQVVILNVLMMMGIMSRMIPSTALATALPDMQDRGAFMSINSSLQQIAGGFAAVIGGMIVVQPHKSAPLQHYDTLGFVVAGVTFFCIFMVYRVSVLVKRKAAETAAAKEAFKAETEGSEEKTETTVQPV
ncbi:Predicted arabinose efflux permease, MFS family [Filimonas lacunae]|uniref:Predicted arabinose efflux permease, MFS family n=1 Tax=Filimonas lacunae TaxID=477680 RepID=A0A173M995_9BACT|nr:MFS transporter [Filimonas lacunae]BAV04117.1 major facilitator superfamily MFS_1 [Filimonas lacunae]SIT15290.1 Predicted arabinose efflux permease, MFS family [Filimonas lacunae]